MKDRQETPGLYVHVPFCLRKCPYCSFYSLAGRRRLHGRYVRALSAQMRWFEDYFRPGTPDARSIFFGGGTPTVLSATVLAGLLAACRGSFLSSGREVETSIEVNPATVAGEDLVRLRRAGFNRLSIGVQSFNDDELRRLGRLHTAAAARQTVRLARRAGFTNLSLDLMYGLPGQCLAGWRETLQQALDLEPEHLSTYELTVEEGTPFAGQALRGDLDLPGEEEVLAMMETTLTQLAAAGFRRYEISSYARPGRECYHNINYWQNGSYIGLGAGAVSCLAGRRLSGVADVEDYCRRLESGRPVWSDVEQLDREARFRETVVMGLRMTAGVSVTRLRRRFDIDLPAYYGPTLAALLDQGLIVQDPDRLRLSARGLVLANRVMAELV